MSFAGEGGPPLFAADWAQTEIDGLRDADASNLRPGAAWSWRGRLLRLDAGPDPARGPLRLDGAIGHADLRRVAASRIARLMRRPPQPAIWSGGGDGMLSDIAPFRASFFLTDGERGWAAAEAPGRSGGGFGVERLVLFSGDVPPPETVLSVVAVADHSADPRSGLPGVAGFSAGTDVETPFGPVAVERLRPGDPVLTDHGATPLRRIRLRPGVAALRLAPHALGTDGPERPVTLGADTWLGFEGPALPELFSAGDGSVDRLDEALVRASDLIDLPGVIPVPAADLIALEVDAGPDGSALLMAGGLPCLGGPVERAGLRQLTHSEAQIALAHRPIGFAPRMVVRGAA